MSSRIRGRRYKHVDPDERYGFPTAPSIVALGPESRVEPVIEVVALDGIPLDGMPLDGTTISMDGTSVTVEPGAALLESPTVILAPPTVTGPQQAEG